MTPAQVIDKKQYGRLLFIRHGKSTIIAEGPWPLLQHKKRNLKDKPQYSGGTFKLAHIR